MTSPPTPPSLSPPPLPQSRSPPQSPSPSRPRPPLRHRPPSLQPTYFATTRCITRAVSALCIAWSLVYVSVGSTSEGKKWYSNLSGKLFDDAKGGVPILTLAIPLLVAMSTCALLLLSRPARLFNVVKRRLSCRGGGDPGFHKISAIFLFLPCLAFLLATIQRHLEKRRRRRRLHEGTEEHLAFDDEIMEIGNAFGMAAMVALSFFLVPVTKHSPLVVLMDWNPIHAVTMHIWCGRIASIAVLIHGIIHMYRWVELLGEDLFGMLIPPAGCWGSGLVGKDVGDDDVSQERSNDPHYQETHENEHGGNFRTLIEGHGQDDHYGLKKQHVHKLSRSLHEGHEHGMDSDESNLAFQPTCINEKTNCSCYHHFRNFTGSVALVFLVVILLSSLGPVRRRSYRLFYLLHIFSGPIVLVSAVLHYHRTILYICPSILYYAACSVPNWFQAWFSRVKDGGVKIVSVRKIPSDCCTERSCVDLTLEATPDALRRYRPGQYVRICIPSVSAVWHPFTANPVLAGGRPSGDKIRLIFRVTGPFTRQMAAALLRPEEAACAPDAAASCPPPMPLLLVDAFHGLAGRLNQVLSHDVVVLVAGGVGITPYLALLHDLRAALARGDGVTRLVQLHWACRDGKLIDFVRGEYFDALVAAGCRCGLNDRDGTIRINIYQTGAGGTPSYSDELGSGESDPGVEEEESGTGPSSWPSNPFKGDESSISDNSVALANKPGVPLTPSRYAAATKDSVFGNLPYFLTNGSIAWVGISFVWYLYVRAMRKDDEVTPRIWGLLAVALLSIIVSLASNFVMDATDSVVWGVGKRGGAKFSPIAEDEPMEYMELAKMQAKATIEEGAALGQSALDAPSSSHEEDSYGTNGHRLDGVTFEMMTGRPDHYQLFDCLDGSLNPALFLCGPKTMMKEIRLAANGKWSENTTSKVSIYEEAFEL